MENLTHSLVGLLCAEVVVRVVERRRPLDAWCRGAVYAIAIIGNNLPDLDFTYSHISGARFGYLLQHRGYTHTVPAAFAFALATLGALFALSKWHSEAPSPRDWRLFAVLALLGPLLHVAMDFANNYVATPMPANPLCWNVLLVQRDDQEYFVRLGRAAIAPWWLAVEDCPYDRAAKPTAPLRAIHEIPDPRLVLSQEYRVSLAELRAVVRERCSARALLRFARVPYLSALQADGSRVIGDLRYDRNPGLDFSDVRLGRESVGEPDSCPEYVPAWRPPRSDILSNP